MATWSGWFKAAKERNIPLDIVINQPADLERLHKSGLPYYDFILIEGKEYQNEKGKIKNFSQKYEKCWIRIYNKSDRKERYYKLDLRSYNDIISFIENLKNINIADFIIQLFEYCENKFGGNIVSEDEKLSIEIIEGKQELVSRSAEPFFHGFVDMSGKLSFFEQKTPNEVISAARKVLSHIKIDRTHFLKGYFEFIVSDKGKVYFLDYKTGFK